MNQQFNSIILLIIYNVLPNMYIIEEMLKVNFSFFDFDKL
jgi:hypothetical protein